MLQDLASTPEMYLAWIYCVDRNGCMCWDRDRERCAGCLFWGANVGSRLGSRGQELIQQVELFFPLLACMASAHDCIHYMVARGETGT